jgi:DNA (cytosine-5)-methyltransferase 1
MNFVSLFSGCGGLDLGFVSQGFSCQFAFDIEPLALATHARNIPGKTICCDLSNGWFPVAPTGVDVVLAGSPCQGFSTAGRRNINDPRNELLVTAAKMAVSVAPKVCVIENVPGALSGDHKRYWGELEELFGENGYATSVNRIEMEHAGVSQRRRRLVLIASKGTPISLSFESGRKNVLRDALHGISTRDHEPKPLLPGTVSAKIARHIKPGQKLCNVRKGERSVHTWDIPEVFGHVTSEEIEVLEGILILRRRNRRRPTGDADPVLPAQIGAFLKKDARRLILRLVQKGYLRRIDGQIDLTHTFNGKYRRLEWDTPSPTVDTKFGQPRYFLHPDQDRGFTVREAARIQGFPDHFAFEGSEVQRFRMIGNAVPPPVGSEIAEQVRVAIQSV